jgi:phage tail-like protein
MAFTVTINRTNSPVDEGTALDVTAKIENTGGSPDTQTVTLSVGGTQRASKSVNLENGQSRTVTLSWATREGDAGQYTAEVASADDSASETVAVKSPAVGVSITGTNAPVTEGDTLYVDVQAQNLKGGTIAQTIVASLSDPRYENTIEDRAVDSVRLVLGDQETDVGTLSIAPAAYREGTDATYEREIWVGSETDTASTTVTVRKPSQFDITVDSTNAPVAEGDPLEVTATVENTGGESGAVTAALAAKEYVNSISNAGVMAGGGDGNDIIIGDYITLNYTTGTGSSGLADSTGLTLSPDESQQVTLAWDTAPGDEGEHVLNALAIPPWERDEWDGPVFAAGRSSAGPGAGCDVPVGVRAGSDPTTVTVSERPPQTPRFDVSIDSTNAPVEEGEDLEVTATVENTGGEGGPATVALASKNYNNSISNAGSIRGGPFIDTTTKATDGPVADSTGLTLPPGENRTVTLTWETLPGDAGDQVVGVSAIPPWEEDEWDGPVFSVTEAGGEQHVEALGAPSPAQVGGDATVVAVDPHGPMKTGRFKVKIDGTEVDGWRSIELPSSTTERGAYVDGDNPTYDETTFGRTEYEDLEMSRGVQAQDTMLRDWRNDVINGDTEAAKRTVVVTVTDESGETQAQWEFTGAWPTTHEPPELDDVGGDSALAQEEITIAYGRYRRKQ